jgi:hypothetical protein
MPDESAPGAVPNADGATEAQQVNRKVSFVSIFLQGKSQIGEAAGEQAEKKTPRAAARVSEAETDADTDAVVFGQLVRLFAMTNVTGEEPPGKDGTAPDSATGQTGGVATAALNLWQELTGAPVYNGEAVGKPAAEPVGKLSGEAAGETDGESAGERTGSSAADFRTGLTEKISDAVKAMGDARESGSGETALKEKEPLPVEAAGDYAPAAGTAFSWKAEPAEAEETLSNAVERALDRFADDLSSAETDGSEIRIVLEPESLGELTISVFRGDDGISARIRSDSRETCAVISDQIQHLIRTMEDKGIRVRDIDVAFGPAQQDLSFAQNYRGGRESSAQYDSPQTHQKTESSDRAGFFDTWNDLMGRDGSTAGAVEYRV